MKSQTEIKTDIKIKILPALNGDCILIRLAEKVILIDGGYVNTYRDYLKPELLPTGQAGQTISHLIVSHIDGDHISGVFSFLRDNCPPYIKIENIWHNSYRHIQEIPSSDSTLNSIEGKKLEQFPRRSYLKEEGNKSGDISATQGSALAMLIQEGAYNWNKEFAGKAVSTDNKKSVELSPGVVIKLLSPDNNKLTELYKHWRKELYKAGYVAETGDAKYFDDAFEFIIAQQKEGKILREKDISSDGINIDRLAEEEYAEDTKTANGSSIAFVIEFAGKKLLMLADAHPSLIVKSLREHYSQFPLMFDLIKIAHHGSIGNTSKELLQLVDSPKFVISTNSKTFGHPDIETIARIISRKADFSRTLYFNYPVDVAKTLDDTTLKTKYNYEIFMGNGNTSINIDL